MVHDRIDVPALFQAEVHAFEVTFANSLEHPMSQRVILRELAIGMPGHVEELVDETISNEHQPVVVGGLWPPSPHINWKLELHSIGTKEPVSPQNYELRHL
jgi:hypothetical protein